MYKSVILSVLVLLSIQTIKACPAGEYKTDAGECSPCPPGHISDGESTSCHPCHPGFFKVRANFCDYCPLGTYSDKDGADECIPCPDGYVTGDSGSSKCHRCKAGSYRVRINFCEWCSDGTHSFGGVNECTPDWHPSSDTTEVKQSLLSTTVHDTWNFLEGTFYSLVVEDKIQKIEEVLEAPEVLKKAWNAWTDVNWTDGPSIKEALVSTSVATSHVWDMAQIVLPDKTQATILTFATAVAPEVALVYEAGSFAYHVAENAKDITENVKSLYEGFKESDFTKAGKAFGDLIKDAIELREHTEKISNPGAKESELFFMKAKVQV